ncbi:ATP-binding protein [Falsibacillus pallidus]|uniref:AAA domain-containing protein n=1 Tax=Falsibacillus pallidus TaxID=493781 RepID=A0A370GQS1_9BACI|nr:ATP-binding protein [Falsibacillus pallidus]RDI45596.1 AAA domain-containing protein [Falsibacillus pallidus]
MKKRLVIITVGKTHSGKTTFAKELEKKLANGVVIDQDNHAQFIQTHYQSLVPNQGANTLKHAVSRLIVDYAKEHSECDFIICNSNLSRTDREYLLNELFDRQKFVRILVHFDLPVEVLNERVASTKRSTNIFRDDSISFEQLLQSQREEVPVEGEAEYLFTINNCEEVNRVMEEILAVANERVEVDSYENH